MCIKKNGYEIIQDLNSNPINDWTWILQLTLDFLVGSNSQWIQQIFLVDPRMDLVGADTIPLIAKKENLIPILHKSNLILRVA